MTDDYGKPPATGWARLVPKLLVSDIAISLNFWTTLLGFVVAYQRPMEKFAYLERPDGAQIMLSQRSGVWEMGPLEMPFGRGAMFQIFVDGIGPTLETLAVAGWPTVAGQREVWRSYGDREGGKREILLLDPDCYLLMLAEDLGERPLSLGAGRET